LRQDAAARRREDVAAYMERPAAIMWGRASTASKAGPLDIGFRHVPLGDGFLQRIMRLMKSLRQPDVFQ
jgi:hypothetical protein